MKMNNLQVSELTGVNDIYDRAFKEMNEILGKYESNSLVGDLHNATDKALVVFRDFLEAAVCAQSGDYESADDYIAHAEKEVGLALYALKTAKAALAKELAAA
jgi:hypothetical protein